MPTRIDNSHLTWTMQGGIVTIILPDGSALKSKPTTLSQKEILQIQLRSHSANDFLHRIDQHAQ